MRQKCLLLFCILLLSYSSVHQNIGWNQNSRLDFLHAIVIEHTCRIDSYQSNTCDKSLSNGHYYSDKAPGIVFLALPAFLVSAVILDLSDIPIDSESGWFLSSWITTIGSVSLITALGGMALFAFLCPLVGQRFAFVTSLVLFLGAAPFPYATMLFSHAAVAGLISIAIWAIGDSFFFSKMTPSMSITLVSADRFCFKKRHILAGVCCGLAISCEFTAAIAAAGILTLAMLTNFKRGVMLAMAAIPAILLIFFNNWACFGNPFKFGYHSLALSSFQQMNDGFFGISFPPTLEALYLILFSPERGLLFWTPFFAIAALGINAYFKECAKLFFIAYFVVLLHVLIIAGYYMPGGGNALGPRHLACIEPFLAILAAFGVKRYPTIGCTLGFLSILLTGSATLIDAMPNDEIVNPACNYYATAFLDGKFAHNLLSVVGLPAYSGGVLILVVIVGTYIWSITTKR